MGKQKLSPKAAAAKKARDLKYAKTPRRTAMKAENQRKRRAAKKNGQSVQGKDYDHTKKRFTSVKANRGGHGKGTKANNTKHRKKG
jgi:hypothetical protein